MKNNIKKMLLSIKNVFYITRNFGIKIGFWDFCKNIIFRNKNKLGKKIESHYNDVIKNYITDKYSDTIKIYKNIKFKKNNIEKDCPIWIFWWQGIDTAPEIVKACIDNNKKFIGNHKIIIINKDNINQYWQIPEYINKKIQNKELSITHLSDILRLNLLYKYGGIWLDATIYLTKELDEDIYNYPFYTVHHGKRADYHICKGLWTTFFIASGKENPFFKYMCDMFDVYLKNEKIMICYLLIDYFIALGYENLMWVKEMIDQVPLNNINTFELSKLYNEKYSQNLINNICNNTYIHKLSYKLRIEDNNDNLYHYIISNRKESL